MSKGRSKGRKSKRSVANRGQAITPAGVAWRRNELGTPCGAHAQRW